MKTEIYNLIILDESGSMSDVKRQTISGCNETINTIVSAQKEYAATQDHYVSIFAFQSNRMVPSRYLIKNAPAATVAHINGEQYNPWGSTPLYDAVGSTLVDLKAVVASRDHAVGSVTIITDGLENSSEHYSLQQVVTMIDALKELGWNFNFIGANIDVKKASADLHISNSLAFQADEEGTKEMFEIEKRSRRAYYARAEAAIAEYDCDAAPAGAPSFRERLREASEGYFDKAD